MIEDRDSELRRRFAELRNSDQEGAPDFARSIDSARSSDARGKARTRLRPIARAALLTFATAAIVFAVISGVSRHHAAPVGAVAEWHAKSDALIAAARPVLLGEMAPLRTSVLDEILP